MDQKSHHLGIRKPKSEKSCSPSPPALVVQNGAEESPAPKLESIDESSSSSTNSVTDKPVCFFQSTDLAEMHSVLSMIRSNFPNLNVQVCVGAQSATPKTKYLSPSQKQWERAFSIDSPFLNSMDRQESKDSGFWSGGKSSFDSAKSWSMSESYSTSLQTPSPPIHQAKAEHENYLKSPSHRSGFKWKKGQAWRYNSNSSNVSTDCSTNCDEPSTQNTSLNLTSFEADSEPSRDGTAARFSNSFESSGLPPSGLSTSHLWASTSKLDESRPKAMVSSFTIGHSMNKAPKRRGKLVREQTIDHQDEQSTASLTNNTVKLESTRFDSISSLISPLTISSKESEQHSGRISPPEKRLSINMDKTFSSTPASVCSSPAPTAPHSLHEAVVAAMIAATIAKPALNNQTNQQSQQHYDFYKDLHKLNLRTGDEVKSSDQYLSTNSGKMVSRSSSSPNYSSSCSSIPSLQSGLTAFAPLLSSFADQYSGKSVSTCSIPVAHFGACRPSNESLRFGARPPEIVITESRVDGEAGEKTGCMPFQFRPQETNGWRSVNSEYMAGMARAQSGGEKQAKPHVCPSCQKRFARSDMLIRHSRLHSGVRPYRCNRCGQEFSRSDHLNTHLRTHTGEKPYSCPHPKCTYAACRKDMITRHLKVHNKNKSAAVSFDNSGDKAKALNADFGKKMVAFPSISFDSAGLNFVNGHRSDKMEERNEANIAAGQTK